MSKGKPIPRDESMEVVDLTDDPSVDFVNGDDLLPQPSAVETAKEMAKVVIVGEPDDGDAIRRAFDRGAQLNLPDTKAEGPTPPRTTPTPKSRTKGGRPPGAETVEPLFATGIIAIIAFTCPSWALPTEEETKALAIPLSNILARRIDLAAKMGKDANDTIAVVVAVMAYLVRVGPIATEVVREKLNSRGDPDARIAKSPYAEHSNGEDSMDVGAGTQSGAPAGSTYHPVDALAQAREIGLRSLSRGSEVFADRVAPVGD